MAHIYIYIYTYIPNAFHLDFKLFLLLVKSSPCSVSGSVVSDSLQSLECSLPGTPVHAILQVRIQEWVTILFSSWNLTEGKSWLHLFDLKERPIEVVSVCGNPRSSRLRIWSLVGCLMIRFTNVISFLTGLHGWCPCSDPLVVQSPISIYYSTEWLCT